MSTNKRELWEHEDHLINQRITWLGVSQGLLFAAYALTGLNEIKCLLPIVGAFLSFLVLIGVIAAAAAMLKISKKTKEPKEPEETSQEHQLGITTVTTSCGLTTALGIPLVFLCSWLFILSTISVKTSLFLFALLLFLLILIICKISKAICSKENESVSMSKVIQHIGFGLIIISLSLFTTFYFCTSDAEKLGSSVKNEKQSKV